MLFRSKDFNLIELMSFLGWLGREFGVSLEHPWVLRLQIKLMDLLCLLHITYEKILVWLQNFTHALHTCVYNSCKHL